MFLKLYERLFKKILYEFQKIEWKVGWVQLYFVLMNDTVVE